jgi:Arc/MetJ family transcription regulator
MSLISYRRMTLDRSERSDAYIADVMYASYMRTTIDIPDELMKRALQAAALGSKREAVVAGLEELIRKADRDQLRRMAGKVDLDLDLRRSRATKR